MSDRRAVSAGHLGAPSVATANETWRVAVGGNRVENMTVDQIAHAFQSGHLNVRTPLWPPGTTGWQALGNFEQFQMNQAAYGGNQGGLAQFEEADDDPTRMWTGGNELELLGMEGMAPPPSMQQRPMARTGVRQVAQPSRPVPMPSRPAPVASVSTSARPAPTASLPPSRSVSAAPASIPPFRKSRGNGLMLVAGLVGLVGLGSAVLAARGNWGQAEPAETATAQAAPAAKDEAPIPVLADPAPTKAEAVGEARLAKYEDTSASAFVAGEQKPAAAAEAKKAADEPAKADEAKAEEAKADEASAEESNAEAKAEEAKARADSRSEKASKRAEATKAKAEKAMKLAARATPKRAAAAAVARSKPEPTVEKAEKPEKVEKVEKAEKAAEAAPQAPANGAVNEAAAAALASSASLASSCRPRGGPAGAGKARVIYSNDGEVQSVEILTAKFRDTLTGSCVRMVFRRAKIPAFKGEPPTFIKSFTIPEE